MQDEFNQDETNTNNEERPKLGWKDVVAIAIAQFTILIPIALGAALVMFLLLLFFTRGTH